MIIKQLLDEDFVNYKKPSMFIGFPSCSWKCEKECGKKVCQNGTLAAAPNIEIDVEKVIDRYVSNRITKSIVIGGLEPFDSWNDLKNLVITLREHVDDDIVIYTGYYKNEILDKIDILSQYKNIIVKFGRFIYDDTPIFDDVLGVMLASSNQYAERIG